MTRIAVIGDYKSPKYKDLLTLVKSLQPDEFVIDMSRHSKDKTGSWKKEVDARYNDIDSAHLVVVAADWNDHLDAKVDLHQAQHLHKELMLECNGQIIPFRQNAYVG